MKARFPDLCYLAHVPGLDPTYGLHDLDYLDRDPSNVCCDLFNSEGQAESATSCRPFGPR